MGGQATILYGGAEFSRDIDFAVAVAADNLVRLRRALSMLKAQQAFPPALSADLLKRGHACRFRCRAPGVEGLRIDVMSALRGVEPFEKLWRRRRQIALPGVGRVAVMDLPDLVRAKKTQRDKDWPMVRRLVEADVERHSSRATSSQVRFWLMECRTPTLLLELTQAHPSAAHRISRKRPAVGHAIRQDLRATARAMAREERRERRADRRYWAPLRKELERWRLQRRAHRP